MRSTDDSERPPPTPFETGLSSYDRAERSEAGGHLHISVGDQTGAADLRAVQDAVLAALRTRNVAAADVSVQCGADDQVRADNVRWLGHDWTTDVITFHLDGDGTAADPLCGCVEVNPAEAARRAPEQDWPPHDLPAATRELMLYAAHGALHLCGLDDATDAQRAAMRRAEAAALAACGVAVPTGHCPAHVP